MYVIIFGEIGDIDYLSATGPFASEAEALAEGKKLEAASKLPNEAESGELAWRVEKLIAPGDLPEDYSEEY